MSHKYVIGHDCNFVFSLTSGEEIILKSNAGKSEDN
jgi:hypothetical protein